MTRETSRIGELLLGLPIETLVYVLGSCDSRHDLLALVMTCQHFCRVWRAHTIDIIWQVLQCECPHFQDALIASRLTQLVVDAEQRGELPPICLSPGESGLRRPDLSELKAALSLHRLARALTPAEPIIRYGDLWSPRQRLYEPSDFPELEEPRRMDEWRAQVCRAIYRVLIVGAALAGTYNGPLFKPKKHFKFKPDTNALLVEMEDLPEFLGLDRRNGEGFLDSVLRSAKRNLDSSLEAQEMVFGPLARWLLHSILSDHGSRLTMKRRFDQGVGRARFCQSQQGLCPVSQVDGGACHSDAHLVVWELMKMLWVVEHTRPEGLGDSAVQRDDEDRWMLEGVRGHAEEDRADAREVYPTAVAVFFGLFGSETVAIPPIYGEPLEAFSRETEASTDHHVREVDSEHLLWVLKMSVLGRRNDIGDSTLPGDLLFFRYFLRRHLGLDFALDVRQQGGLPSTWIDMFEEFTDCNTIFSHDDMEGCRPFSAGEFLRRADFLDGSELLVGVQSE